MKVSLHDGQRVVATDPHRFRIICAGRRWGKSVLSQLITLKWATTQVGLYWIVSPTYRQGKQIHWRGFLKLIPREWILKKNEVELSITLKNGSVIELKGAENPDSLRGIKLRGLVIDEIASIRNWDWVWKEVLRPTLTDYQAPALFISTPKGYNHFHQLFEQGQADNVDYKSWKFTSYDNPTVPGLKEEVDKARNELPLDLFSQEYLAEFTRFTGLIYKEFNPDTHVHYFDHQQDSHGDYFFGLDFAVRGWTASVPGVIRSDGNIFLFDTYKVEGETATMHIPKIREMLTTYASLQKWIGYADPSGWNKTQQKDQMIWSLADEYIEDNLPIIKANNEVTAGINYVRQLFLENKIHIHPRCTDLVDELLQYQWKDQPSTQVDRNQPEEPRKFNDHLVDALRYMLYSKPQAPEEEEPRRTTPFTGKFELKIEEPDPNADQFSEIEIQSIYD